MTTSARADLKPLAPGVILALLSILFGFLLGGAFGANEEAIKGKLQADADAAFESVYDSDAARRDAVVKKSWIYLKRAHLHGGAIGAAALASIALLGMLGGVGLLERASAIAFGAGALLYPFFWLLAGFKAPGLGSTGAAKESLEFLAVLGAGLCILGLLGTLTAAIKHLVLDRGEG